MTSLFTGIDQSQYYSSYYTLVVAYNQYALREHQIGLLPLTLPLSFLPLHVVTTFKC